MTLRHEMIGDLPLELGGTLKAVQIAFESVGKPAPGMDNVVLALHGYTSGPDMILPTGEPAEGSWRELIGPRRAIDTDRYLVVCPNAIGSSYGSTGPASLNPENGKPYGNSFPPITMRDVVNSQYVLLERLGIKQLVAVVGGSFGGLQALEWSIAFPTFMRSVVAVLASLGPPPTNIEAIRANLARDPNWSDGDYYERGNLTQTLARMRVGMLKNFGVEQALSSLIPDAVQRNSEIEHRALKWAQDFDPNSLLVLMKIMVGHNVNAELRKIRARLLYVLSRTDPYFSTALVADALMRLRDAGVDVTYFEIDSDKGHSAATSDAALWSPVLSNFLA